MKKLLDCNCSGCVDLHIHSTSSDGTLFPHEILSEAVRLGLKAISITDHDTLQGSRMALEAGIPCELGFVSGVEISVVPPPEFGISGGIHILGYGVNVDDPELFSCLKSTRIARLNRFKSLLVSLAEAGVILSEEEVLVETTGGVIGRPHIARVMVKKGFASSIDDAFDRLLGYGKPAYVSKVKRDVGDVLKLIENAGGVSVLAHPYLIGIKDHKIFEKFIIHLKSIGLVGIEAIHPKHSSRTSDFYFKFASEQGLLITGGTDFHGENSSGVRMGVGTGNFCVPFVFYEKLLKVLGESR